MKFVTLANRLQLPPRKGLYFIKRRGERRFCYVGKAVNLRARHSRHDVHRHLKPSDRIYYQALPWPYWIIEHLEADAIRKLKPRFNDRQEHSNYSYIAAAFFHLVTASKLAIAFVLALATLHLINS
jgi:excinuclease UvrABC nuclease subunit